MLFNLIVLAIGLLRGAESAGWQLVWSDEFNGSGGPNDGEWSYEVGGGGWGNNELEYYTSHNTGNARQEGGHLVINARVQEEGGRHFTSARLTSKKSWTYGKFEARAKLPKGKNLWPAIWMMPKDSKYGGWAASGEIDIMEARGERPTITQGTIHYGGSWPNNIYSGSGERNFNKDFTADYHTFAVEWDQNMIRWYVDGQEYHRENINRNMWSGKGANPYNHNGAPFDQGFFWILNIAVGGNFFPQNVYGPPVTPDEARRWEKPSMEIDYLRVYQWK
ncbi:glucan endo-1,3-beta-glucosidase-like [Oppia nitens]|uniref:glucan endo-1,3-beta-glucosidase-like n=1 Tax=Oppia nitens TaxID=1686743 RepID=UPI0023DB26ED|nr:glucan endo-1,3-beta-glucosidase-like [Oppia nitens]